MGQGRSSLDSSKEGTNITDTPWIYSSDSSINIVPPSGEGSGFEVEDAVTFTNSSTITVTGTAGNPPTRSLDVPSTAFISSTNTNQYPVGVQYNSGIFQLSLDLSNIVSIPQTIIVGGKLGSTPNATTIANAITTYATQLATATYSSPWVILVIPMTDSSSFILPPNVHIIALIQHSVTLTGAITLTDTSGNDGSTLLSGIVLQLSTSTIQTSSKTGGIYRIIIRNCEISAASTGLFTISMRPITASATNVNFYQDEFEMYNSTHYCYSIVCLNIEGGITNIHNCRIKGEIFVTQSSTGIARVQVRDCSFAPNTDFTVQPGGWVVVRNSVLGGTFNIGSLAGSPTPANTYCIIDTCELSDSNNNGGIVILDSHQIVATQTTNATSSQTTNVYIVDTNYPSNLIRSAVGSTSWSVTQPNIIFTATSGSTEQGLVDRPTRFTLLSPPGNSSTLTDYTVDYANVPSSTSIIPYVNNVTTSVAPPVPPYTVDLVTTAMTSNATRSLVLNTSTTKQLGLAALINSGDRLAVDIVPPILTGVSWYD